MPVVAALSVTTASSGRATQFSAAGSVGPSSPIVSYRWNFSDSRSATTTGTTTSRVYVSAGNYTATVTETDAAGASTAHAFTGETMLRNGGPSAVATASVVIAS